MRRFFGTFCLLLFICCIHKSIGQPGQLIRVIASGVPTSLDITLCLNGKGPLSCQKYSVSALTLDIKPLIVGHYYPYVGIKINTPGYTLSGCTPSTNGYCLFSMSNASPATLSVTPDSAVQYWVSTSGSDSASGDARHPFLTIAHAKSVVRSDPRRGQNPIYVNIAGGTYRLTQTLSFDQGDSGADNARIVYRAMSGEKVIISGGQPLSGWTQCTINPSIWKAQGNVGSRTIMPRQLYVNGSRATRARSADYPNYYTPNTSTGYSFNNTGAPSSLPPNWTNVTAIEAVTVTQWKMMRCPIDHITWNSANQAEVVMANNCWHNANVYPSPWYFHLLSWFENACEFMTEPGYWYMNPVTQVVYYIPKSGEDMNSISVELPVLDYLIQGIGNSSTPVAYLSFEGLTFRHATWYNPSNTDGYVCDQSGFHLTGSGHNANLVGHDNSVTRTPGNISFSYAQHITFTGNVFEHLGAAALDFGTGSQNNQITNNIFNDVSSGAIQLGGVDTVDHHPSLTSQKTEDNTISNNLIEYTGQEFYDTAGIYIGFTTRSVVKHNDILHVPWSGIAIGWGWGLFDPDGFPGLPYASPYMWGFYLTPTPAIQNQIIHNKIQYFLEKMWDGGAIYSTGYQGTALTNGQYIAWNVAMDKRTKAGGNTFYTDGGSRYITLEGNVSLNNPQGYMDFGPCGLSSSFITCTTTNVTPYGQDTGGCIPYGDLFFKNNYLRDITHFYDICFNIFTIGYPVRITMTGNMAVTNSSQVPAAILNSAGRE